MWTVWNSLESPCDGTGVLIHPRSKRARAALKADLRGDGLMCNEECASSNTGRPSKLPRGDGDAATFIVDCDEELGEKDSFLWQIAAQA